jgi:hypothetical protein
MHGKSFSERFRSKNAPPKAAAAPTCRIARSTEWFVKVHDAQLARLLEIEPKATQLFLILLRESLRHRGKAFVLPTDQLAAIKGLSRPNLRRALRQLESCKLISVKRNPPKPPVITVSE